MLLGPNAFNRLGAGGLPVEVQALSEEGRTVGKFQMLGDYRWYPSEENIAKAKRELDAVQGQPYLRGFSYGDEVEPVRSGRRRMGATTGCGRCSRRRGSSRRT